MTPGPHFTRQDCSERGASHPDVYGVFVILAVILSRVKCNTVMSAAYVWSIYISVAFNSQYKTCDCGQIWHLRLKENARGKKARGKI